MINNDKESTSTLREISSLRKRIARYDEYAAHFTRLAEAEPVARIRVQWETVARDYRYLARTLGADRHLDAKEGI
jgi:hypothetical protein